MCITYCRLDTTLGPDVNIPKDFVITGFCQKPVNPCLKFVSCIVLNIFVITKAVYFNAVMASSSKIKLVALAVIYILHVAFFDALMAHGTSATTSCMKFAASHASSSQSNPPGESAYRLLLKHEQAKQVLISFPKAVDIVSGVFNALVTGLDKPLPFCAAAQINVASFKLYRLFRVFLI